MTAVTVPDVGGYEREPSSLSCEYTVSVLVEERSGVEISLPAVNRNFAHIAGRAIEPVHGTVALVLRAHADGVEMPSTI